MYVPNLANNRSSGTASYWIPNEKPAPAIEKCRIIKRVEFTIAASIGKADSDVVSYGVDYYTGRRATIEQRISGEVTYRNLDYLSGFGDTGEVYYLRAECSPEAGSNKDIQIKGTWIP